MDILTTINQTKLEEVELAKKTLDLLNLKSRCLDVPEPRNFSDTIRNLVNEKKIAIIAEIKKASPSKGLIRENFQPQEIAMAYEKAGASCLSILTDIQYFQGDPKYIFDAKNSTRLPILRKDFIVDEYQIYQSKYWQADAILLIAMSLDQSQLEDFEGLALELGLSVLVELHHEEEIRKIENLQTSLIGINNRNLKTFEVNLEQTLTLKPSISEDKIIVCESGIYQHSDIKYMREHGVYAFLVGESLMRQDSIESALINLIHGV